MSGAGTAVVACAHLTHEAGLAATSARARCSVGGGGRAAEGGPTARRTGNASFLRCGREGESDPAQSRGTERAHSAFQ